MGIGVSNLTTIDSITGLGELGMGIWDLALASMDWTWSQVLGLGPSLNGFKPGLYGPGLVSRWTLVDPALASRPDSLQRSQELALDPSAEFSIQALMSSHILKIIFNFFKKIIFREFKYRFFVD